MKLCPTCDRCYETDDVACAYAGHAPLEVTRPGQRVVAGKYRLDRMISSSFMGAVYKGVELETGAEVALKLLRPGYSGEDPKAYERFRREGVAASAIVHPNVVRILGFGQLDYGEAYLAMEYIEGRTLREYITSTRAAPLSEVVMIGWQVANCLDAAHLAVVLHRDLKPENIMLTRGLESDLLVKVIDFGLAKLKPSIGGVALSPLTPLGVFLGTVQYSSPECCSGSQLDARSDIYSLGIILYELLAGRRPFLGTTLADLCQQHIKERPTPVKLLRPDTPEDLARLVMRSLAKDPAQRPQTAREFAERLRGVARSLNPRPFPAGHPILAPPGDETPKRQGAAGRGVARQSPLPDQFGEIITGPPRHDEHAPAPLIPQTPARLVGWSGERALGVVVLAAGVLTLVFLLLIFLFR